MARKPRSKNPPNSKAPISNAKCFPTLDSDPKDDTPSVVDVLPPPSNKASRSPSPCRDNYYDEMPKAIHILEVLAQHERDKKQKEDDMRNKKSSPSLSNDDDKNIDVEHMQTKGSTNLTPQSVRPDPDAISFGQLCTIPTDESESTQFSDESVDSNDPELMKARDDWRYVRFFRNLVCSIKRGTKAK